MTQDNSYDALGRRYGTSETTGSGTTPISYMYDGLNVVLAYNGSSSIASLLGLGLDELYLENIGGVQSSVLKDALGSVVGLTNSSKALTDTYSYEPYGATTHAGTSVNGQLFAGQTYDFNNLYYMRRRYYLPAIGRFISRDPIGLAGGLNLYAYANDDPIDFSDPTGLCSSATYDGASGAGNIAGAAHGGSGESEGIGGIGGIGAYNAQWGGGNTGGVAIGTGGVGGPPAFQRGLLPDQAGGGVGGDVVQFYHGQNGAGLTLVQALGSPTPGATPSPNCGQQCWDRYQTMLKWDCGVAGGGGGTAVCALGCTGSSIAYGACFLMCERYVGIISAACAAAHTVRYGNCKSGCP